MKKELLFTMALLVAGFNSTSLEAANPIITPIEISDNVLNKLIFRVDDRSVTAGKTYAVAFRANELQKVMGYQFTINFDPSVLSFDKVEIGALESLSVGNFGVFQEEGAITTSWHGEHELKDDEVLFTLTFTAKQSGQLSDLLSINSRLTRQEAYTRTHDLLDVALQFDGSNGSIIVENKYEVYQNFPNPFEEHTKIGFNVPKASKVSVKITDSAGKVLKVIDGNAKKGYNEVNLHRKDFASAGVLYYEVQTDFGVSSKSMLLVE